MLFNKLKINGVFEIFPEPFVDSRGLFARTFCKDEFLNINHQKEFIQMNFSYTEKKGTLRGMHYQRESASEIKLIRCTKGRVFDVVVDLRKDSPTFLKWIAVELSREKMNQIYIPNGCAHGFQTLEDNCEMIYNHTAKYSHEYEKHFVYNDQSVNINWPLSVTNISEKDRSAPELKKIMGI